jgi:hypothetical protein
MGPAQEERNEEAHNALEATGQGQEATMGLGAFGRWGQLPMHLWGPEMGCTGLQQAIMETWVSHNDWPYRLSANGLGGL